MELNWSVDVSLGEKVSCGSDKSHLVQQQVFIDTLAIQTYKAIHFPRTWHGSDHHTRVPKTMDRDRVQPSRQILGWTTSEPEPEKVTCTRPRHHLDSQARAPLRRSQAVCACAKLVAIVAFLRQVSYTPRAPARRPHDEWEGGFSRPTCARKLRHDFICCHAARFRVHESHADIDQRA